MKNLLKKALATTLVILVFGAMFTFIYRVENTCKIKECTVTQSIDGVNTIEDKQGNIWQYEGEELQKNSKINIVIFENEVTKIEYI